MKSDRPGPPRRRSGRTCRARRRRAASTASTGTRPGTGVGTGSQRERGPEHGLPQRPAAAADVAADEVRVVRAPCRPASSRARASTRSRKPGANRSIWASMRVGHVGVRARRARGSTPTACACPRAPGSGRPALGCTDQAVRPVAACRPAATSASLRPSRRSVPPRWTVPALPAAAARPGHRAAQREVDLEHARPVAEPRAARGGTRAGSRSPASATSCRGVTSSRTARAAAARPATAPTGRSPPRRRGRQLIEQRPGRRALPPDHRPAHGVRRHREQQPERAGHRGAQRQHGVGRHAGEQGPGLLSAERAGHHGGGRKALQAEPGHGQRVAGQ